jgi:hypothetical protein
MIFDSPSNNKLSENVGGVAIFNLLPRTDRQNENTMSLSEKAINLFLVRSVPRVNHKPDVTDKLDHIKWYQVHLAMSGILTRNFSGDRY